MPEEFFTPFNSSIDQFSLPERFTYPFDYEPHPLCLLAAEQLQLHIQAQNWEHNFGLTEGKESKVIGKMFGVLLVQNKENEIGYLAAFSGKLGGSNHHPKFVPPVFDGLEEGGFLNVGMLELTRINEKIWALEKVKTKDSMAAADVLKERRKNHSVALQEKLFDQYHFLNQAGESKALREIFEDTDYKNPPGGAGECAAPKMLQYAFLHQMKPLALAEFWWGLSPKSKNWEHRCFYPVCREKCEPILVHMLDGMDLDDRPFVFS